MSDFDADTIVFMSILNFVAAMQCAMMQYFLWQELSYNEEKKNLLKIYKIDGCALSDPFQILSNQFSIST